jgi:hypothetical protein
MTVKDITVRFVDGIGVRVRGEPIIDMQEGVYIVQGSDPGTKITFFTENITYAAESNYDEELATAQAEAQGQENPGGIFR